jgi:transposase
MSFITYFRGCESRSQALLLLAARDDYVTEDNAVRFVEVFINELDLAALGFEGVRPAAGRPGYHSSKLLKLYLYGDHFAFAVGFQLRANFCA